MSFAGGELVAPDRAQPLAGLATPAAESLYMRLRARKSLPLGSGPHEVDPRSPVLVELLDLGLAFRSGEEVRPVDHAVALRLLLEHRQAELIDKQQRILDGWTRLSTLLPLNTGGGPAGDLDGVLPLTSTEEIVTRAAELYPSAKRRMRCTDAGTTIGWSTKDRLRTVIRGTPLKTRFQLICQVDRASSRLFPTAHMPTGEVRLRATVPITMLHVDDAAALIAPGGNAQGALLVRVPAIISMFAEWFDLLWSDPGTMAPDGHNDQTLNNMQRRVLELMSVEGDETIARKLGTSLTTVRRHVKAIYTALGVDNRFAAGVAAAKRGWI